jgi:hypothetical protein
MTQHLHKHNEDFVLMLEAGFVAIMHQDEDSAQKLFKAAQILDAENIMPKIGMAYMHFLKLEIKQAIIHLKQALAQEPENEFAKALYGVCLTFSPDLSAEGAKMLHESAKSSHDPEIKKLSKNATEFYDHYIKAPTSPEQLQSKKRM